MSEKFCAGWAGDEEADADADGWVVWIGES
jgi:hypothetical protein